MSAEAQLLTQKHAVRVLQTEKASLTSDLQVHALLHSDADMSHSANVGTGCSTSGVGVWTVIRHILKPSSLISISTRVLSKHLHSNP